MKALSVLELAKIYGMNRQSIYKRVAKGDLTKNSDGKIDLSEAIRVFGEPSSRANENVNALQSTALQKSAEVDILKRQVDMLQKQLELAQEREQFQREQLKTKDEQIERITLLLGIPLTPEEPSKNSASHQTAFEKIVADHNSNSSPQPEAAMSQSMKPNVTSGEQTQSKRKGLFGRVVSAILN